MHAHAAAIVAVGPGAYPANVVVVVVVVPPDRKPRITIIVIAIVAGACHGRLLVLVLDQHPAVRGHVQVRESADISIPQGVEEQKICRVTDFELERDTRANADPGDPHNNNVEPVMEFAKTITRE